MSQAVDRHIDALDGVSAATIANYRAISRAIATSTIGEIPVDVAERADVSSWIAHLEKSGRAEKTVRNYHALLSSSLARAVDDGLATRNVAHKVRVTRQARDEMVMLTPAEFAVLIDRVSDHYRPLIMWLYGTGMRLGEATAVRIADVHLWQTPATVTITRAWKREGKIGPPKTSAGRRTVSIPAPVVEAIRPLMDRQGDALLFVNANGDRVQQASLHDLWQRWIRDVTIDTRGNITHRTPALGKVPRIHSLRHSHASAMLGQGISLFDLSRRLGHSSISITADVYGHLMPEAQVHAERAASLTFGPTLARIEA